MTLIEVIRNGIDCDDEDDSDRLIALYEKSDAKGKETIDHVLICVCGWSMKTLLEKA